MRLSFVEDTRDMLVDMLMAQTTRAWTLADLDRLPDDGNRMVRPPLTTVPEKREAMPTPILVVEVLSRTTRQRDQEQKRNFYLAIGVPEYWIVDRWERTIQVVKPNAPEVLADTELLWQPAGAAEPLRLNVADYFRAALSVG